MYCLYKTSTKSLFDSEHLNSESKIPGTEVQRKNFVSSALGYFHEIFEPRLSQIIIPALPRYDKYNLRIIILDIDVSIF